MPLSDNNLSIGVCVYVCVCVCACVCVRALKSRTQRNMIVGDFSNAGDENG